MESNKNKKFGFLDFVEFLRSTAPNERNFNQTLMGLLVPFIMLGVSLWEYKDYVYSIDECDFFEGYVCKYKTERNELCFFTDSLQHHNYDSTLNELGELVEIMRYDKWEGFNKELDRKMKEIDTLWELTFVLEKDTALYNKIDEGKARVWYTGAKNKYDCGYIVQIENNGRMVKEFSIWYEIRYHYSDIFWPTVIALILCVLFMSFVIKGIRQGRRGELK